MTYLHIFFNLLQLISQLTEGINDQTWITRNNKIDQSNPVQKLFCYKFQSERRSQQNIIMQKSS